MAFFFTTDASLSECTFVGCLPAPNAKDTLQLCMFVYVLRLTYEGPGQKFLEYRAFSDLLACKPQITASQLADKQAFKPTSSSSLWRPGTTSLAEQQPLTGLRPINIGHFSKWLLML